MRIVEKNPGVIDYSKEKSEVRVWLPQRWYDNDSCRPTTNLAKDLYDIKGEMVEGGFGIEKEIDSFPDRMHKPYILLKKPPKDSKIKGKYVFSKGTDPDYSMEILTIEVEWVHPFVWLYKLLFAESRGVRTVGQVKKWAEECQGILLFAQMIFYGGKKEETKLEAIEGYWCGDDWADRIMTYLKPIDDGCPISQIRKENTAVASLWPPQPIYPPSEFDYFTDKYVELYKTRRGPLESKIFKLATNFNPSVTFVKAPEHPEYYRAKTTWIPS